MNQTQSKKFHCTYLLHFFPFDSQVCNVIFEIEQFSAESVELVPHQIQMLSPTELTQYFIQSWVLDYNDKSWFKSYIIHVFWWCPLDMPSKGIRMQIVFKRRLTNELLTTYLPTFLLLLISYATTYFKPFYFEAAVTVNLTVMLVTTTLFIRSNLFQFAVGFHAHLFQCYGKAATYFLCSPCWHLANFWTTNTISWGFLSF